MVSDVSCRECSTCDDSCPPFSPFLLSLPLFSLSLSPSPSVSLSHHNAHHASFAFVGGVVAGSPRPLPPCPPCFNLLKAKRYKALPPSSEGAGSCAIAFLVPFL
ncbi:hypothetical protein PTSG_12604 [Salpingoeca rosetta]|uniref:Uncharacterized protein n=1 Tax=Salpingoeca rosetta (strain ATCC 50818 / BSB-021) TaxID=946362 RepID=F2UH26_SALR5|nr:uncharacterized protein PTSG_12604 [Salpingoeca rosetta]EGD76425.1 hypothetical protein PTSG_12604 [Salpingoeca rosetta]|eukprot:XP_004991340.1 hypothetical protein PTSG_12604 [Salpingoeca rosetta]